MGNRIFYACQLVEMAEPVEGEDSTPETGQFSAVQGLQSVGVTTNFNLEPVYQLGQLSLYENYEEVPEIEVTLNKVLDGARLIYDRAMGEGDLVANANKRSALRLSLFPDNVKLASGNPTSQVLVTPVYLSSVTYTFPTEGNFTEEVTLVANNKTWDSTTAVGHFTPNEQYPTYGRNTVLDDPSGSVLRRGQLKISDCVFPTDLGNVNTEADSGSKITNITITASLGREELRSLGRRGPYLRYVNFPLEITAEFEVQATEAGDRVSGEEQPNEVTCAIQKNLKDESIKIVTCDGMVLDLGNKCKLTSVGFSGGDTGGGNATITYSYQTYNDFNLTNPTNE